MTVVRDAAGADPVGSRTRRVDHLVEREGLEPSPRHCERNKAAQAGRSGSVTQSWLSGGE
jgi:hypothetical protein